MSDNMITQNVSSITGFYHYTIICEQGNGKVSVFYVIDQKNRRIFASFSFCSPEDAMIGRFSKTEGRNKALNRFFGINGETLRRVIMWDHDPNYIYFSASPFDQIKDFIQGLFNGLYTEDVATEYELDEGQARRIVLRTMSYGTIKVPNWICEPENKIKITEKIENVSMVIRQGSENKWGDISPAAKKWADSEGILLE